MAPGPQGPPTPVSASWPGSPSEPGLVGSADPQTLPRRRPSGRVPGAFAAWSLAQQTSAAPSARLDLRGAPGTPPQPHRPAPGPTGAGLVTTQRSLLREGPAPAWQGGGAERHAASWCGGGVRAGPAQVLSGPGTQTLHGGCWDPSSRQGEGAQRRDESCQDRTLRPGPGRGVLIAPPRPLPRHRRAPPSSRPGVVSLPRNWAGTRARPCQHGLSLLIKPLVYGSGHHPRRASQVALRGHPHAALTGAEGVGGSVVQWAVTPLLVAGWTTPA